MRPLKLVMTAFGAYGRRVELDFRELGERKFFLINGPTGAGKTTILDAMCFALYGDTSGGRDARTVRSDHAPADVFTEVEFTFAIGNSSYRMRRSPEQERPKKRGGGMTMQAAEAELWELAADGDKLLADSSGGATRRAEELLGFKSSQFRQVVLLPQGEFKRLLTADSVEREKIMQTLFQTEHYAAIERYFKEKARSVREAGESLTRERDFILQDEGVNSADELKVNYDAAVAAEKLLTNALKKAQSARQRSQAELDKGRQDDLKLKEYRTAAAELAKLEEKKATVDEYRVVFNWAKQAGMLDDIYKQLEESRENAVRMQQEMSAAQQLLLETEQYHQKQNALYQVGQQQEGERKSLAVEVNNFKDWLAKAARLESEQNKLTSVKARLAENKSQLHQLEKRADELKMQQQSNQQKLIELVDKGAAAEILQLELDKIHLAEKKFAEAAQQELSADKLMKKAEQAEAVLRDFKQKHDDKKHLAEKLNRMFIEGQAAMLADGLTDGAPCPVCGSEQHPHLAQFSEVLPSKEDIELVRQEQQLLADKLLKEGQAQAIRRESCMAAVRLAEQLNAEAVSLAAVADRQELADKKQNLADRLKAAELAQQERTAVESKLAKNKNELASLEEAVTKAELSVKDLESQHDRLQGELTAAAAAVPDKYRDIAALRLAAAQKQQTLQQAEQSWQAVQLAYQNSVGKLAAVQEKVHQAKAKQQDAADRLTRYQAAWTRRLSEADFAGEDDYKNRRRPAEYVEKLQQRIEMYDKSRQSAADRRERSAAAAAGIKPVDLSQLEQKWQETDAVYAKLLREHSEAAGISKKLAGRLSRLAELEQKLAGIGKEYGLIGHLADIANGKNQYGVTFQRYVLGNLLDEVADAASLRLKMMSRNRYQLQRTDEKRRKNAQSGLELEVFDYYTGAARSVATLSGGESFLASLALSLGLADVVQNYAGGIRLDTILVDEGFGTLDPEALDMAIKTLTDLQAGGRLVGIISHVPELKERIDARLEVTLTKQGSTARFVI